MMQQINTAIRGLDCVIPGQPTGCFLLASSARVSSSNHYLAADVQCCRISYLGMAFFKKKLSSSTLLPIFE